jgi:hypothetical protein
MVTVQVKLVDQVVAAHTMALLEVQVFKQPILQ